MFKKALGSEFDFLFVPRQFKDSQTGNAKLETFLDHIQNTKNQNDTKETVTERYLHFKDKKQG